MQGLLRLRPAVIFLFLLPLLVPFAGGQVGPGVEVTCQYSENPAKMDVSPTGSNYITATCTVENTSLGTEEIAIDYDADGLNTVGPTSVSVAGGASVDIQVAIAGTEGMAPQSRNVTVSAEVESFNGIPIAEQIRPSGESNILIEIDSYSDFTMEISPNSLKMDAGGMPGSVTVLVRNMGNDADLYDISVATGELSSRGFNVSISPDTVLLASKGGSASFTISMTPPEELSTEKIEVKVIVSSSWHGNMMSKSEVFTVNATAAETGILDFSSMNIPTWAWASGGILASLVVLAVVGSLIRKRRGSQYLDEFEDDDEDDDDIDDLDDLDDLDGLDDLDDLDDELDDLDMDLEDLDF